MLKFYQLIVGIALIACPFFLSAQGLSDVTDVTLTFIPVDGGATVTATAEDPDGDGPQSFQVDGDIELLESTEYDLSITLFNSIGNTDLTADVVASANDFLFFFAFTDELFVSPAGDGNIDNREDPLNYTDLDGNNLPVGLSTNWEAECAEGNMMGTFQVILKQCESCAFF